MCVAVQAGERVVRVGSQWTAASPPARGLVQEKGAEARRGHADGLQESCQPGCETLSTISQATYFTSLSFNSLFCYLFSVVLNI